MTGPEAKQVEERRKILIMQMAATIAAGMMARLNSDGVGIGAKAMRIALDIEYAYDDEHDL